MRPDVAQLNLLLREAFLTSKVQCRLVQWRYEPISVAAG